MTGAFRAAAEYGRMLTVKSAENPAGRTVRGFIQPLDIRDASRPDRPTKPGLVNDQRYLLLVPANAIDEGETEITVTAGSRLYELLRAESVTIGAETSHWEGVLRLKGGA